MNTNKKYDAVKQNKEIQHSEKSAAFEALRAAENKKDTSKSKNSLQ